MAGRTASATTRRTTTGTSPPNAGGAKFNCAAPKNDSPNNTGLVDLPPAVPAWITYDGGSIPEFGSGSESPMGGPTYRYDADNPSKTKFPAYFDGKNFAYEFGRALDQDVHRRHRRLLPAGRDVRSRTSASSS